MYRSLCLLVLFVIIESTVQIDYQCMEEAGLSENEFAINHVPDSPYNEREMCYEFCVMKKDGMVNDDGTLILEDDPSSTVVERASLENVLNTCAENKTIGNPCKTLFDMVSCIAQRVFDLHPIHED